MAEVHDCFTPTELVLMEDLGFADRGMAWKEVLAGTFDLDGELAVNPDGGLKSFGHPIGASGLRMLFECWLQLRGEAPAERTVAAVGAGKKLAMTHNLGGAPGELRQLRLDRRQRTQRLTGRVPLRTAAGRRHFLASAGFRATAGKECAGLSARRRRRGRRLRATARGCRRRRGDQRRTCQRKTRLSFPVPILPSLL